MNLSVTDPIQPALDRTRRILFDPFDFNKWLTLGFCAFLAGLGSHSSSSLSFSNGQSWSWGESVESGKDWAGDNWPLVVGGVLLLAAALIAVFASLLWLQARGRFMLLDGVAHDRGAVQAPWAEFRRLANSAFRFKLTVWAIGAAITLMGIALVAALALGDRSADDSLSMLFFACLMLVLLGFALAFLIVDVLLQDFVIPAMYARRIEVMQGWAVVRAELLSPYPGRVCLYLLMRLLISIVCLLIVLAGGLATLCVAFCFLALPYIGTVLTLPLIVFVRCYSLSFLEQLGGPWRLFQAQFEPEVPPGDDHGYAP